MANSRKAIGIFIIATIVAILAFVALSATATAAVITVPSAGNETIQQAINNASDGDTILVNATAYAGTTETIDVNKSDIIIRSVNGRAVVSAGGASDHVFDITDQTNVTLEGFTIRDAQGTSGYVAGIYMYNATECTISNNTVTNISATVPHSAYGIDLWYSNNNTFSSSITVSNITGQYAHGIYLYHSSNNGFSASTSVSTINGNSVYGIYLSSSSSNNTFSADTSVSNVTATDGDAHGIYLGSSSNYKTFSASTSVSTITATNRGAHGIYLGYSSNNTFSADTSVSNVTATDDDAYGISLSSASNNTFSASTSVSTITATNREAYGIRLMNSNNNRFSASTSVSNVTATNSKAYGIFLYESSNNTFSASTSVSNVTATDGTAYGISLGEFSDDNTFTGVTITPTINGNESYEFYSEETCDNNVVTDMTIGNPTTISFTYGNGIWIKRVEAGERPGDPANVCNIGKYINASNLTTNSWIFLNVSYDPGDVIGVDESSLRLYHWNGAAWELLPQPNGVNTVEDYVYSNITTFSQIAAFGNPSARVPTLTPIGLIALISALSVIAALTISTRRKRR
jgi:hypothetical protein